jgi:SAM-dependent methyltransferase
VDVVEFVLSHLHEGSRVLEVGCGDGTLTRALDAAGFEATGIDPAAPDGPIFRKLKLEDVEEDERFDAVVAIRSLHHVTDLAAALDKILRLLEPGGSLVLDEFAWDRLDVATADWLYGQRRILAAGGRDPDAPATLEDCCSDWEAEHVGLHGYETMREALDTRFVERHFDWLPYLYRLLDGVVSAELERALLDQGAIQATGWRYVGEARNHPGAVER